MPMPPTYPGIYIEEIPSSARTITAAPTSIAVFVGYSHPFKSETHVFDSTTHNVGDEAPIFGQAVELFSYFDYQRYFGGYFNSSLFSPDPSLVPNDYFGSLPLAVSQFFLNGGTHCYVVGLRAKLNGLPLIPGSVDACGITFTARELTDSARPMVVSITPSGSDFSSQANPAVADMADITITYGAGEGALIETYRKVLLGKIDATIGTAASPISGLVVVVPTGTSYPSSFPSASFTLTDTAPPGSTAISIAADFNSVFQQDSSLDKVPIFNLMVLPGVTSNIVLTTALAFCERKRAFLIIDPPPPDGVQQDADWIGNFVGETGDAYGNVAPLSPNAAIYFPYLKSNHPQTADPITLPPAATVAGIYASTDLVRGVWKAPAGLETTIVGTTGVVPNGEMSDLQQSTLNQIAINCLRSFHDMGTVVYGARTSVGADLAQQQWKYVPVRRMALFLEQTLHSNLGWVIFEPNGTHLWTTVVASIQAFMLGLFRQGAFQGTTPSDAFQVKCDSQTTTQADIDNGIVNIIVAFAPLKPAEFIVIQISQLAGQIQCA